MTMKEALEQSRPGLLAGVSNAVRLQQFSPRTQQLYLHWITQFVIFHDLKDPTALSRPHIQSFLDHLKSHWQLSRARLNQALQALAFLYEQVLNLPQAVALEDNSGFQASA